MPRKFGNEIRLPGTTGIDNLPIPLTINKYYWSQNLKLYSSTCAIYKKMVANHSAEASP